MHPQAAPALKMNAVEWTCAITMAGCVIGVMILMPKMFSDLAFHWATMGIGIFVGVLIVSKYVFDRWISRPNRGLDITIDFLWLGFASTTVVGLSLFLVDDTRLRIFGLFSGQLRDTLAAYSMTEVRLGTWILAVYFLIAYFVTAKVRIPYANFASGKRGEAGGTKTFDKLLFFLTGLFAFVSAAGAWCIYFLVSAGITA